MKRANNTSEDYTLVEESNFLKKVNLYLTQVHFLFLKENDFAMYADKAYENFILSQDYTVEAMWRVLKDTLKAVTGFDADLRKGEE